MHFSTGVLMWEIFSEGNRPYPRVPYNENIIHFVSTCLIHYYNSTILYKHETIEIQQVNKICLN